MRAGIHAQVDAERVFDAFVADVRWLGEMATVEQAKALNTAPPDLRAPGVAVWVEDDDGKAALQQERERQRQEYIQAWGRLPS